MSSDTVAPEVPTGSEEGQGVPAALEALLAAGDRSAGAWATEWLAHNGLPDPTAEMWRYTPLDSIVAELGRTTTGDPTGEVEMADLDRLAGRHGSTRIVFVDGRYSSQLSDKTGRSDSAGEIKFFAYNIIPDTVYGFDIGGISCKGSHIGHS